MTNLIYKILVLRELTQLEVTNHYFTVASFEFVTQLLDGVLVDKCASGFTFCVNSIGDSTGVLGVFETNCVNIAVGGAKMLSYKYLFYTSYNFL